MDPRQEKQDASQPPEMGFLAVLSHSMLSALGISSVMLAPLPMIFSQLRLAAPWPRVTALMGAVLALVFLKAPVGPVLVTFIFGLFVAEAVRDKDSFWKLALQGCGLALGMGLVGWVLLARMESQPPLVFWGALVDTMLAQLKETMTEQSGVQWATVRSLLYYEGPFLLLSGALLSIWFSVGLASHLGWFEEGHPLSAPALRKLVLPHWVRLLFVALFLALFSGLGSRVPLLGGVVRLMGTVVFVQGCVSLSVLMAYRGLAPRFRTLIYVLSIFLGFYAVVGMGLLGPWFFREGRPVRRVLRRQLEEGT